jgi:hypothetical protein
MGDFRPFLQAGPHTQSLGKGDGILAAVRDGGAGEGECRSLLGADCLLGEADLLFETNSA